MSDDHLTMWTIYERPRDYPDGYVARLHRVTAAGSEPTDETLVSPSLEAIRLVLQREKGLAVCFPRQPDDDPVIVETWM